MESKMLCNEPDAHDHVLLILETFLDFSKEICCCNSIAIFHAMDVTFDLRCFSSVLSQQGFIVGFQNSVPSFYKLDPCQVSTHFQYAFAEKHKELFFIKLIGQVLARLEWDFSLFHPHHTNWLLNSFFVCVHDKALGRLLNFYIYSTWLTNV